MLPYSYRTASEIIPCSYETIVKTRALLRLVRHRFGYRLAGAIPGDVPGSRHRISRPHRIVFRPYHSGSGPNDFRAGRIPISEPCRPHVVSEIVAAVGVPVAS